MEDILSKEVSTRKQKSGVEMESIEEENSGSVL